MSKRTGLDLIKESEGLKLTAYVCPAGVNTIGYGTTRIDGQKVQLGTKITKERAQELAEADYDRFEAEVKRRVKVPLNENQLGALVSFAYNLGPGALDGSTILRLINAGHMKEAAAQFDRWNKANGQILPGLTTRRNKEEALFLKPVAKAEVKKDK